MRPRVAKVVAVVILASLCFIVYARPSAKRGAFAQAEDFPRGPLCYAQFQDLPSLVKRWNESELKKQYLESANFKQLQSHHLFLKLLEHWEEFNNTLGFPLDLGALAESSDNKAALAIYDIGRLELVFIAPLSEEKAAATKWFQSQDQFEAAELPDGTTYYSRTMDANDGRRQQKIAFATLRGRLVVASSEKLLLRTLANIKSRAKKDSLADDPAFKTLSLAVTPHLATIWVDQTKLNADYYFKHYWLMSGREKLKGIRAGMFDLEMSEGKLTERREFLTEQGVKTARGASIAAAEAARLSALMPEDVPYLRVQSLNHDTSLAASITLDTLLGGLHKDEPESEAHWRASSYDETDFYEPGREADEWDNHTRLGDDYDLAIDDVYDARVEDKDEPRDAGLIKERNARVMATMRQALQAAEPAVSVLAESPRPVEGPLFAEFRRAAVLRLENADVLNRQSFEQVVSLAAQERLMIAVPPVGLEWKDARASGIDWRELELPALGWKLVYVLRGDELFIANSAELLQEILARSNRPQAAQALAAAEAIQDLTLIRPAQREEAFDRIFKKLDAEQIAAYKKEHQSKDDDAEAVSQQFFSGNVASLLDVAAPVRQVAIKRSFAEGHLREEIEISLK